MSPPVDLKKAAKALNAELVFIEMPKSVSGLIIAPMPDMPDMPAYGISINSRHSYYHQRFTIAHEIGHLLLGHLEGRCPNITMFSNVGNFSLGVYPLEREANIFAAEMLIPTPHIKGIVFSSGLRDINSLCRLYGASQQAIRIKLTEIGAAACNMSSRNS
jgi:Zn-dependent peptidase ImmA (M78 family)